MMMGSILAVIFLFLVVLIGIPLLVFTLITGGGLATLFRSRPRQNPPNPPPPATAQPAYVRKCPTCGRMVKADWNVCPSCGAALT
jgi:uncharacterized SAM-binding protein YcdF (DUF218 family)